MLGGLALGAWVRQSFYWWRLTSANDVPPWKDCRQARSSSRSIAPFLNAYEDNLYYGWNACMSCALVVCPCAYACGESVLHDLHSSCECIMHEYPHFTQSRTHLYRKIWSSRGLSSAWIYHHQKWHRCRMPKHSYWHFCLQADSSAMIDSYRAPL